MREIDAIDNLRDAVVGRFHTDDGEFVAHFDALAGEAVLAGVARGTPIDEGDAAGDDAVSAAQRRHAVSAPQGG